MPLWTNPLQQLLGAAAMGDLPNDPQLQGTTPLGAAPRAGTNYGQPFRPLGQPSAPTQVAPRAEGMDFLFGNGPSGLLGRSSNPSDAAGRQDADLSGASAERIQSPLSAPGASPSPFAREMQQTGNLVYGTRVGRLADLPTGRFDPGTGYIRNFLGGSEPAPDHPYRAQFDLMRSLADLERQTNFRAMLSGQAPAPTGRAAETAFGPTLANQLGQQRAGIDLMGLLGAGGIPGSMQSNATNANANMLGARASMLGAEARGRENDRYGPEARYDTFYNQAYNAFPPGTPHADRVRRLQEQGMSAPRFLTGEQPSQQTPGQVTPGVRRPVPGQDPNRSVIDSAFEGGLSAFPRNPQTGARNVQEGGTNAAITQIIEGIPDDVMRSHFPDIQRRLQEEIPGGSQALDAWLNTTNNPIANLSMSNQRQQRQIQRMLGMAGMRQQHVTPLTSGANPVLRAISIMNPMTGYNLADDYLRGR